ncbi:hypothetical protein [Bartonella harrusi]|uniref:hypothetical protein n=1 Tax=Bartonella harrusi TaxID=2961895 RepID=UPI002867C24C|nr:hypothetical protein [Bartonella harrusi]
MTTINVSKKYEFTDKTRKIESVTLYRIRALRDFGNVKAGDLGGFIEKEENLSHDGNCWVYDDAIVAMNAVISENAKIFGNAYVRNEVSGDVIINSREKTLEHVV